MGQTLTKKKQLKNKFEGFMTSYRYFDKSTFTKIDITQVVASFCS